MPVNRSAVENAKQIGYDAHIYTHTRINEANIIINRFRAKCFTNIQINRHVCTRRINVENDKYVLFIGFLFRLFSFFFFDAYNKSANTRYISTSTRIRLGIIFTKKKKDTQILGIL